MIVTLLLFVKNVSVSRKMEPRVEKKVRIEWIAVWKIIVNWQLDVYRARICEVIFYSWFFETSFFRIRTIVIASQIINVALVMIKL